MATITTTDQDGVRTLCFDRPAKLNGWTFEMMQSLSNNLRQAASDDSIQVVILTGSDPYYCAGVNLAGSLKLRHPKKLKSDIVAHNQELFEQFLKFPKPILAAVNGPAIGAAVTSATLCDAIIASEKATFSTPFARLGVAREGCSSVLFAELMGEENAERMLGSQGWVPTGQEALEAGLVQWCVSHEKLLQEAQKIASDWAESSRPRTLRGSRSLNELMSVNARESIEVADSFLDEPFLMGQFRFLWNKKKKGPALMFFALGVTNRLWRKLL